MPARGGSTGFPGKNLAPFLGEPLVAVAVTTALHAGISTVLVSTDDDRIGRAASTAGATVIPRPTALAGPTSRSVDAVLHAVADQPDDTVVVLLQPTSPLRTADDIRKCLLLHGNRPTGSVVQVAEQDGHHPWKACVLVDNVLAPAREWADLEAPRQTLPPALRPTGGVYVVSAGDLRTHRRIFVPDVLAQVVPAARAIDIDGPADLALAERTAAALGWV
ncbi:MAG TPA: acylneuraminate cytidylyltransferase family protein [Pseudonocardiaceae bacterium]|nr:acylneuraminate cytidylyltransferase family protein [Pseudonocardiaceae bacterium]